MYLKISSINRRPKKREAITKSPRQSYMHIYKNKSVDAVKPIMMVRADVKSVVAEPVNAGAAGAVCELV